MAKLTGKSRWLFAWWPRALHRAAVRGVSLVELIIACAVLTVAALFLVAPFKYMSRSTQSSKYHTLASNLAQEQVEILKNKSYYNLLLTTAPVNDTRFSPAISYDSVGYPTESLTEGGIGFTRATKVEFVYQDGTGVTAVPYTSDDTGLKQITVYVMWRDSGEWRNISIRNLMSSLSTNQLNSRITGTVTKSTGGGLQTARVQAVENPNYYALTNAAGAYSFSVAAGSYTLICTSNPYYTQTSAAILSVDSGVTLAGQDFTLTAISSKQVTTDIYLNDDYVISQVVVATGPAGGEEYIELYNPTPNQIPVWSSSLGGMVDFYYYAPNGDRYWPIFNYVSTFIPAQGYFLFANTTTVHAGGVSRTADAYYTQSYRYTPYPTYGFFSTVAVGAPSHAFFADDSGAILGWRYTAATGWYYVDTLGWKKGALNPTVNAMCEGGSCIPTASGFGVGDQLVRASTPGGWNSALGPSYDSDYSSRDWAILSPLSIAPSNKTITKIPVAAYPLSLSWINYNDNLSQGGTCTMTLIGGTYPVCRYSTWVATGTWTAVAYSLGSTSSNLYKQFDNVVVDVSNIAVPNATTSPAWPVANYSTTILDSTASYAYVAGYVTRTPGGAFLAGVTVSPNTGNSVTTSAFGRYFAAMTAGSVQLTANPNNTYSGGTYSSQSQTASPTAGSLTDNVNFQLAQASAVRGYFKTSAGVALPGRVAVALQGVAQIAQATSDGSGNFYLRNLPVGTYTISPALDPAESVSPSTATITLTASDVGTSVFSSSFTVSNGLAQITGKAYSGTSAITTGVYVLASTTTLGGTSASNAPTITGASGCAPCYYETSSDALGNFTLSLRTNSTSYKVYGWYSTMNAAGVPTTVRAGPYTVSVTSPSATVTQNITW